MSSPKTTILNVPLVVDTSMGGRFIDLSDSDINCQEDQNKNVSASSGASMAAVSVSSPTVSHAEIVANARKLLATLPSKSSDAKKLRSPASDQAVRLAHLEADEESHVSSPTVSCGTFSDDDFSICSTEDLLAQVKNRLRKPNPTKFEDDDLLSTSSSLNTRRQSQISGLKKKLHTSEMTKLELLNQCADLWTRVENVECNHAKVKEYRQQNVKLREDSANIERDFMNEVSELVHQMTDLNTKYTETITERDDKIADMELEIYRLKEESAKLRIDEATE